jgi:polar amino acid transport system substrate-binding protein
MRICKYFLLQCTLAMFAFSSFAQEKAVTPRSELAATGKLRVGIIVAPVASAYFAVKDAATGQLRGVTLDLGAALAQTLSVPVEFVSYANSGAVMKALGADAWDVTFIPIDDDSKKMVDFGPAYVVFEFTYLVPPGSAIHAISEVDRAGVRIAAVENSATTRILGDSLKNATLVPVSTIKELYEMARPGKADAIALARQPLERLATTMPGARVLDGKFGASAIAIAVPKGRPAALAYVSEFMESAKASGTVQRAFDAAGIKGVPIAPASSQQ